MLAGFDLAGRLPRRVTTVPTVREPDTVALDPQTGTLFLTGALDGVLETVPLADQRG